MGLLVQFKNSIVHVKTHDRVAGFWNLSVQGTLFLSINAATLPANAVQGEKSISVTIDGSEFEFSKGFTELHTRS